ncbi:MAG: AAA family ATPase [Candidatus Moranbacteria bacterium]|nr:AAA family ATPase [Candidatus Moranbacteria bacterium]
MQKKHQPWADKFRPKTFKEFFGQEQIVGKGKFLFQAIKNDTLPSLIFWGPPGCGKTTLAHIIAQKTKANFINFSAATSGISKIKTIITKAKTDLTEGKKTILFIDEIHRFNKRQQDILLPYVEKGTFTLIGATTENPSFEINNALLSRTRVIVLKQLNLTALVKILKNIAKINKLKINPQYLNLIAHLSNADARTAINSLQIISQSKKKITKKLIKDIFQKSYLLYDKGGEEHYNIISALHKSLRANDTDAALYWLARMIEGGEDPLYIARRLVRFASEDIGLANNSALMLAVSTYQACHFIGYPECDVILAQCVAYLAKSKKDISCYKAIKKARKDAKKFGNLPVPLHIRNAPTDLMKNLGYGKGYKYPPDFDYKQDQQCLPKKLQKRKYL